MNWFKIKLFAKVYTRILWKISRWMLIKEKSRYAQVSEKCILRLEPKGRL